MQPYHKNGQDVQVTHKFGIRLPHSIEDALKIDQETRTDFWHRAIEKKEMRPQMPTFMFCDDNLMPAGYKKIRCYMIFDVKIVDLTRKARYVANGSESIKRDCAIVLPIGRPT